MSDEKFTPGPWHVHEGIMEPDYVFIGDPEEADHDWKKIICCDVKRESGVNDHENAHLIAAAPQMYRLLSLLVEKICQGEDMTAWRCAIGNVLRKARGEK